MGLDGLSEKLRGIWAMLGYFWAGEVVTTTEGFLGKRNIEQGWEGQRMKVFHYELSGGRAYMVHLSLFPILRLRLLSTCLCGNSRWEGLPNCSG